VWEIKKYLWASLRIDSMPMKRTFLKLAATYEAEYSTNWEVACPKQQSPVTTCMETERSRLITVPSSVGLIEYPQMTIYDRFLFRQMRFGLWWAVWIVSSKKVR
jgi:hypothetical protein